MLHLAVPVVFSELGWMAMGVVDTLMVGRIGAEAIGTVALGSAFFYSCALFALGLLLGLDTMIAQAFGAGDIKACHRALRQGLYLAFFTTPFVMLFCWVVPVFLPSWGITPSVSRNVGPFLNALSWGTLPLLLYAALRRYLQATGHVKPVTFALVTANLVNLAFNWIFIYDSTVQAATERLGGRPRSPASTWQRCSPSSFGTLTARKAPACSTSFPVLSVRSSTASSASAFPPLRRSRWKWVHSARPRFLRGGCRPRRSRLTRSLALNSARPVTFQHGAVGASSAAAVRVGHAVGRGEFDVARRAGWIAVSLGVGFMFCAALVFIAVPRLLLRAFTPDARVVEAGVSLLALAALFQMFDGIQVVTTGALRGLGDTRTPMLGYLCHS